MTRRTHFAYRIDLWSDDEKEVVEYLADVDDLTIALATYHAACKRWPGKAITLRQGPPVIKDNRRSRLATLFSFPWSDKPFPRQRQAQPLNRQSCDRDYNSRKEPADAEEHQNIIDFGHGVPLVRVRQRWCNGGLLAIVCLRRD